MDTRDDTRRRSRADTRRRRVALCAVVLTSALATPALVGQSYGSAVSVHGGLGLGGYWADENFQGNGVSFGGALDVFPASVVGFELAVDGGEHSRAVSSVEFEGSVLHVSVGVLVRFTRSRIQPYVIGGGGLLHARTVRRDLDGGSFESEGDALMGNLGVGAFLFPSRRVSLRPEVRLVGYDASSPVTFHYRAWVGVGYHF